MHSLAGWYGDEMGGTLTIVIGEKCMIAMCLLVQDLSGDYC